MTADAAYRAILEEAQQIHAAIAGDATASGTSRVQARADYAHSLLITKGEIDSLIRWLLETALDLGAIIIGAPGRYKRAARLLRLPDRHRPALRRGAGS